MAFAKPPIPPHKQPSRDTLRTRAVMKAYLAAPIETRHLAAQQADKEFEQQNPSASPNFNDREAANRIGEATAAGMRKMPDNPQVEY